ncbi:Uncharacterised protein [Mycobacteroides abscessus subsp. abscessus]|uniref:hypothetical protein n=1 Tax=Mycobacteroides abscessus TaxID=36809 RepID=UPI000927F588|nr:hypothetical protein [Mycobacteroides abscessus]SHP28899.1 Uncharacterised protein [Mycobacteroides abscessus subsp. abscessus]SHP69109.1 Uncharacterised protein [Mycobacteroides abscessus subsp. abscessus]SHY39415.1 Uncharacterised protein [Mycobacteroides abscessus subsp. abscessus]SKD93334.1 Uncharacterised protein [Mycobacteroides abscessus subsp. abscessus]
MTAAARRIAALRARAVHPATPVHEARVCREKLAALAAGGPVWVPVDAVPGMHIDIAGITIGGEAW